MASAIDVDRTSYYRKPTRQMVRDQAACAELRSAHIVNRFYGVRRLRVVLGWSLNKTRRIRRLAGVTASTYRSSRTRQSSPVAEVPIPDNSLKLYARFVNPDHPHAGSSYADMAKQSVNAWVQDFTHVRCSKQWYYLAVVIELASRQVVGWSVGGSHDTSLTLTALNNALVRYPPPSILHSDQGSEYLSYAHKDLCDAYGITLSCSAKSSPWQNGYMESFFGKFKPELGSPRYYSTPESLFERVAKTIRYYNNERIHSSLGMSPAAYAATLRWQKENDEAMEVEGRDGVLRIVGA